MNSENMGTEIVDDYVRITDVTLREGDQAPLTSFNATEKAMISLMLSEIGIDVVEVGFGFSREDGKNIKKVSEYIGDRQTVISSLGRANKEDTEASLKVLKNVKNPRIHIFLAMSEEHIKGKFNKKGETLEETQEKLIIKSKNEISRAKKWSEKNNKKLEIEFSPEDATGNSLVLENEKKYFRLKNNPDFDFLVEVCEQAILSGATIINVPDTLGNLLPHQTYDFFKELSNRLEFLKKHYDFKLSCHIHNDLALSSANAIEAVRGGVGYTETTILGIGERAGNTRTEDIVGIISEKGHDLISGKVLKLNPAIKLGLIGPVSDFVKSILGFDKSLQTPFIGALSDIDGSGVHNASSELYGGTKDKTKYGGATMPEFFSPRGGVNQIISMLKCNGVNLRKDSELAQNITKIAAKKSEELKALYSNNIYAIYLSQVKNFHIEKLEIHNNELDLIIKINGDTISLKGSAKGKNGVVKIFIKLLNNYLGSEVIDINNLIIKSKTNIYQEHEKFKKRVIDILSEDYIRISNSILKGERNVNKYSEAKAISQVVLNVNGTEITSIAGDNNVSIANIKAILEGVIVYLVNSIKK